jgi:hypothetical protein
MGGACRTYGVIGEAYTGFLLRGNLREKYHLVDPRVDGRIILRLDLQGVGCGRGVWSGSSWLRIETGGGHLSLR